MFKDRIEAGQLLADKLEKYKNNYGVILAFYLDKLRTFRKAV